MLGAEDLVCNGSHGYTHQTYKFPACTAELLTADCLLNVLCSKSEQI